MTQPSRSDHSALVRAEFKEGESPEKMRAVDTLDPSWHPTPLVWAELHSCLARDLSRAAGKEACFV